MHQRFTAQHWGTSSIGKCQQYLRIFFFFFFGYQRSPQSYSPGPVPRVDNAIHFINFYPADKELLFAILIHWIVIALLESVIQRLNKCSQVAITHARHLCGQRTKRCHARLLGGQLNNNYSPKRRWLVLDIYRTAKQ